MTIQRTELKPDRQLINNEFDGYKLSLDSLPIYSCDIDDVDEVHLSEDLFSYQHVKVFSLHNHLHQDPWNINHVYYVSTNWTVKKFQVNSEDFKLNEAVELFKIPRKVSNCSGHYNVTLNFVSEQFVALADGFGNLYVLKTVDRSTSEPWTICFTTNECAFSKPFVLLYSTWNSSTISCLLLYVVERSATDDVHCELNTPFTTFLEWIVLSEGESVQWQLSRTRRLTGSGSVDYAAIEPNGNGVCVISEKEFKLNYDSEKQILSLETEDNRNEKKDSSPAYAWQQTTDEITVWFKFSENVAKKDILFQLTSSYLSLSLKGGSTLLEGALFSTVDIESSTWTLCDDSLEVFLTKSNKGLMWEELVKNDNCGEEILSEEQMQEIHQRLAHLTSDQSNPNPQGHGYDSLNPQQLEECDAFPVDSFNFVRWDGEKHKITLEVNLSSHQWLFSVRRNVDEMPAICIRHDVDGLLWQPITSEAALEPATDKLDFQHVSTFNALGYVLASKQQKKFLSCSVDSGFAVLCDVKRHAYLYFQPSAVDSQLRNRKTGVQVMTKAVQKIISLDNSEVLGLQVSDRNVFILTREHFYFVKVIS